jgi:hypothetical protein
MSDQCRSCGADILWTRTRKGKKMPVNREPDEKGRFVLLYHEDWILAHFDRRGSEPGAHYTSHYATCPDAEKWRKR